MYFKTTIWGPFGHDIQMLWERSNIIWRFRGRGFLKPSE